LVSLGHRDGSVMVVLGLWAQHIVTLRRGAADFIAGVHWIYKIHLSFGMSLFALFPFSPQGGTHRHRSGRRELAVGSVAAACAILAAPRSRRG